MLAFPARRSTWHVVMLVVLCTPALPAAASAQRPMPRDDSVAIVRAVWSVATGSHPPLPRAVPWLWAPDAVDSVRVVPLSAAIRSALTRQGIPASPRRPAGDDTLVFRFARWDTDSTGVGVTLTSAWSTILGQGARRCRARSGNGERFHVERRNAAWVAERVGPVTHGDAVCMPVP